MTVLVQGFIFILQFLIPVPVPSMASLLQSRMSNALLSSCSTSLLKQFDWNIPPHKSTIALGIKVWHGADLATAESVSFHYYWHVLIMITWDMPHWMTMPPHSSPEPEGWTVCWISRLTNPRLPPPQVPWICHKGQSSRTGRQFQCYQYQSSWHSQRCPQKKLSQAWRMCTKIRLISSVISNQKPHCWYKIQHL